MSSLLPLSFRPTNFGRPADPRDWQWYAPRAAVGLFVLALVGLLWVLHRQELEENHAAVIRDILWVEQSIRFSLDRDVEQLRQLGQEAPAGRDPRQLEVTVKHLLLNSPGLLEVALLNEHGVATASAPVPMTPGGRSWLGLDSEADYRLATVTGKAVYSAPTRSMEEEQFAVFVPYYRQGVLAGTVVGIYGLKAMLANLVPWWLAKKHRVTIQDSAGNLLAAKSNVEARGAPDLTHQVALDPPGHGLLLHVESYGSESRLLRYSLTATIVVLACILLWNLRLLRRHVQRRLATEQELRAEHAFRKSMEDSLHTGMRAVNMNGVIVYVNPAFCRMVGYTESELIGHAAPQVYWPPEERNHIEEVLRVARADGSSGKEIELKLMRGDGERFDALIYDSPLIDADGKQIGWMGSLLDITERKRARERVRQQEQKLAATARLVTMGEMASAIAHELNQPLSAIASYATGCLNVLQAGGASAAEFRDALEKTAQQAQRAGRIIRRVHEFVRKSEPVRTDVHINTVVQEVVSFAEAEARTRRVKIHSQLSTDDPELKADPLLLQEVLLNLLRNGMDAMAATPVEERELKVITERAGQTVTVTVRDRGCGLSPEVQAQLFDPFFTTKPEGMGMGLHICRSIMEVHRGRVWAEPNPGGGSAFSFCLPMAS